MFTQILARIITNCHILLIASRGFSASALQFRQLIRTATGPNCLGAPQLENGRPLAFPSSESSAPVMLNTTNSLPCPESTPGVYGLVTQRDPP